MSGRLVVVKVGAVMFEEHRHEGERIPDWRKLKDLVGGYIEPVKVRFEGRMRNAYVDEEGLRKRLPFNEFATSICVNDHRIFGTMVVWVPDARKRK